MNSYFQVLHKLEVYSEDVRVWMMFNKLKLKEDKAEFMVIRSWHFESIHAPTNPASLHHWR